MVTKIAIIEVKPGMEQEFISGVHSAAPLFLRSEGCQGLTLERSVEVPEQFILRVRWETIAHNTDIFVNSENFKAWRVLVGHCFARKPHVYHSETLLVRAELDAETELRLAI